MKTALLCGVRVGFPEVVLTAGRGADANPRVPIRHREWGDSTSRNRRFA